MTEFVLDNSVTMRWCFEGGAHEYADRIQDRLAAETDAAVVPILWRYEVSAVLSRAQLKGLLTERKVAAFLEDLAALNITMDTVGMQRILSDVHSTAVRYRLTSYDAAYLELALRRDLPLATLDAELRRACQASGAAVV